MTIRPYTDIVATPVAFGTGPGINPGNIGTRTTEFGL